VLNIYASLGAGIGHPDFYGPTIGITLWRLSFSGGLIPARGKWSTAFSGELELGNFTPLLSMSAGSSVLKWSENETLTSIFLGLTRKTGHRFSVSIKAGAAIYEEYFSNRWYPAGDISLRINAFKHSG
jgi:hypothetical protein